jgi:hypothetical protein
MPMTPMDTITGEAVKTAPNRYRLPGIEREGIAQLSLLETALWPLRGGQLPDHKFETTYTFPSATGRQTANVTVRAALGLQPADELVLWGLLGATKNAADAAPVLMATPYWMLRHLGPDTGCWQYDALRESLLRLAVASYQNTGFYNPETKENEYVAFQFLSILLPTVGGAGETVDNDRSWRIEWNPAFMRLCRASGANLLFDLDLYRRLTPASRRLFLKLQDRFWRCKRVFMAVNDLTINGLGFSAARSIAKRKFDLLNCIRELLDHRVLTLGRGQTDPRELFLKRGKGSYVVVFYEGEYFRRPPTQRVISQKNAVTDDPLYEPLRNIGVDGPAIRRLFKNHTHAVIQRWVRITDAAMNERPKGFAGFRVSPAAFLIDGVQYGRTLPDWMHAHEKRQQQKQWEQQRSQAALGEPELRRLYDQERAAALAAYLASTEGRQKYKQAYPTLLAFYKATDPIRCHKSAHEATIARIERMDFHFAEYDVWAATARTRLKGTSI